jgi:multiple RNA-binding domain-containing protein 1
MSRLIIKNLPSYVTSDRLREHFQQKAGPGGSLTDFKVALKPDGTSRRFGFVGYKTEKEALKARDWFDRTFIDSTRISVSVIEGAKDAPTPRPNKRARVEPPQLDETNQITPVKPKGQGDQLEQYLKVMQPRTKSGPSWANEPGKNQPTIAPTTDTKVPGNQDGKSEPVDPDHDKEEGMSDLDWMRRRMNQNLEVSEKVFDQSDEEMLQTGSSNEEPAKVPEDPTRETILQTSRLFVRNLAFSCTDIELEELFKPFGEISQVCDVLITDSLLPCSPQR